MPPVSIDTTRTLPTRVAVELPDYAPPDELPSDPVALKALVREQQAALEAIRLQALRHLTEAQGQLDRKSVV